MTYLAFLSGYLAWMVVSYWNQYKEIKQAFNMFVTEDHPDEFGGETMEMGKISLLYTFDDNVRVTAFFLAISLGWLIIYLIETFV